MCGPSRLDEANSHTDRHEEGQREDYERFGTNTLALLDPHHGAEGITRQLEELVSRLAPVSIDLLDVGDDILAQGDEPTLKSPLADALSEVGSRFGP